MPSTFPTITPFATEIAERQYFRKNIDTGEVIEDYEGMLRRVASHVAKAEAIDAYKADNGRYPEWYMSFEGRRKNLLDLDELDAWIAKEGYTPVVEEWEAKFLEMLRLQLFSPAGRILAGSGSAYGQLMNCFVLGPNGRYISGADDADSIDGIYELSYKLAKVTKTGGGCGISLSFMRESGSHVHGSGGKSSGPISFLRLNYNTTLRVIKLEGVRRGAGMATLKIQHPDVLDFITAKDKDREELEGAIEAFNISLLITDDFMEKVKKDDAHTFISIKTGEPVVPSPVNGKYHLPGEPATSVTGNPNDPTTSKEIPLSTVLLSKADMERGHSVSVSARWLWDEIIEHAWARGDPGILFIDRINDYWPFRDVLGEIEATNPCGEEPLWFGESCCLGSLVLDRFVKDGEFDWDTFDAATKMALRFLDDVLTINVHPIEDTMEWCDRLRRVGLGIMGDAVTMTKMGYGYDSHEAMVLRQKIATRLNKVSEATSRQLGEEKGFFPFAEKLPEGIHPRRNVHMLSIAPTGTISMVYDTTSGIEPVFALALQRRVGNDYKLRLDPTFETYLREHLPGINLDDETLFVPLQIPVSHDAAGVTVTEKIQVPEVVKAVFSNHGSIDGLDLFTEDEQRIFRTAHDVSPESHVHIQGTWQRFMDAGDQMPMASISKTVNMPNDATLEDVMRVYEMGFYEKLKGITMYRDGSRDVQVLRTDIVEEVVEEIVEPEIQYIYESATIDRPARVDGAMVGARFIDATDRARNVYVFVGCDDDGNPLEVFITDEDGGSDVHPYASALGKMISMSLQAGAPPQKVSNKLRNIQGGSVAIQDGIFLSVPAMVGRLLQEKVDILTTDEEQEAPARCEGPCTMINQGGCEVCTNCGYSKCS